ncbi:hypothetical protein GCM10025770_07770 [Viridibacterium curvum]|uniref:Uncharacterized protein n=1 Tax=Viridibacterium curvum TaxID=1101404 RepID=A0ABP9QDY1_9RHOO
MLPSQAVGAEPEEVLDEAEEVLEELATLEALELALDVVLELLELLDADDVAALLEDDDGALLLALVVPALTLPPPPPPPQPAIISITRPSAGATPRQRQKPPDFPYVPIIDSDLYLILILEVGRVATNTQECRKAHRTLFPDFSAVYPANTKPSSITVCTTLHLPVDPR